MKAEPDPQCIMMSDFQLQDLVQFLTNSRKFSIFTADTTYNTGNFCYTYHMQAFDATSKKHSTRACPILVHQRRNFVAFNYFASTLICFNKHLQQIQMFRHLPTTFHLPHTTLVFFACEKKYSFQTRGAWNSIIIFRGVYCRYAWKTHW